MLSIYSLESMCWVMGCDVVYGGGRMMKSVGFFGVLALIMVFVLMPSVSFATTDIYYSVGTNTSDLKLGSPTVTIVSGVAVFNVSQPDKIGVGDRIEYVSNVSFISGRINSTAYNVTTAKGAVPSDVSDVVVYNVTRAFNSLASAESGASDSNHRDTSNLAEGNYTLNIACYADAVETTALDINGWTTEADNYIKIYTPVNPNEVGVSQRHDGKWGDGYKLIIATEYAYGINTRADCVVIEGLQIYQNQTANERSCISTVDADAGLFNISNNILRNNNKSARGIEADSGSAAQKLNVWNNIIYDCSDGIYSDWNENIVWEVYSNTFYNIDTVVSVRRNNVVKAVNNILNNVSVGFYSVTYISGSDYNIASDGTSAGGVHDQTNVNLTFVDVSNGDFHLSASDVAAINNGTDLSSEGFSDDIDGDTRSGTWDIGADEYVAGDSTPPNVTYVSDSPDPQGLGENVTISATVIDDAEVQTVLVGITLPGGSEINYTMTNQSSVYSHNYLNWVNGTYNYTIYAKDATGNLNDSRTGTFEIYSDVYLHVKTLKDTYGANEIVNITDPFEFDLSGVVETDGVINGDDISIESDIFSFVSGFFTNLFNGVLGITGMSVGSASAEGVDEITDISGKDLRVSGTIYISDHFDDQDDWDGCSDHPLPWSHYGWNSGVYCNSVIISGEWNDAHGSIGKSVKIIWPDGIVEKGMETYASSDKGSVWMGYWWRHDSGYTMPEQDKWIYFTETNGERHMLSHKGNTICFFDRISYNLCVNIGTGADEHPDTSTSAWYDDTSWHHFIIYASPENDDIRIWRDGTELGWNGDNLNAGWYGSSFDYGTMTFGYQSRHGWTGHVSYFDDIIIADNKEDIEAFLGVSGGIVPERSNPSPTGTLTAGITSTNISLTTDINATCRYSNVSGTNYTDMTGTFTNTNSTNHSTEVSGLQTDNVYYVRCNSTDGNENTDDFNITFSVNASSVQHKADKNNNSIINMPELMSFISRWKANATDVSKAEVEEARGIWFGGGGY